MKALIVAAFLTVAPVAHADEFCGPNGPRTLTGNSFAEQFCAHEHMGGVRAGTVIEAQPALPVPTESGWLLYTGVFAASFVFGGALCWRLLCAYFGERDRRFRERDRFGKVGRCAVS
ncbi:hypothetical protein, partial [Caballeronia sp. GAWG1-1]